MDNAQKISFLNQLNNIGHTLASNSQQIAPKTMQGHVSKILPNDFIEFTIDASSPFTLPVIKIPQAFSKYHREPTQVGDKGYAVPNDFSIGGIDGQGGGTANMYGRSNLATHVFHPISIKSFDTRDPNMFLVTGGPSGHTIQSHDKKTSTIIDILNNIVHTSSNNITHIAALLMTHNAQNILHQAEQTIIHKAEQTITHIAPQLTMEGLTTSERAALDINVTITGNLHATGTITTPTGSVGLPGSAGPPGPQGPQGNPGAPIQGTLPQIVTGAKGGNTALASLLSALVNMGLIVDNTTA
jgi:hypothetical protein